MKIDFINVRVPSVLSSPDSRQVGAATKVHPVHFWHPHHPLRGPFHLFTMGTPYRSYMPSPSPEPHMLPARTMKDGGALYMLKRN